MLCLYRLFYNVLYEFYIVLYELEENMKFTEFPYERIDLDKLKVDFLALCEGVDKAQSGEELFALHQKY